MNRYKAEPQTDISTCPLERWKTHAGAHGRLAVLAAKYLASPATTAPCERLFSLSGNILCKKRAALSPRNVNIQQARVSEQLAAPSLDIRRSNNALHLINCTLHVHVIHSTILNIIVLLLVSAAFHFPLHQYEPTM